MPGMFIGCAFQFTNVAQIREVSNFPGLNDFSGFCLGILAIPYPANVIIWDTAKKDGTIGVPQISARLQCQKALVWARAGHPEFA